MTNSNESKKPRIPRSATLSFIIGAITLLLWHLVNFSNFESNLDSQDFWQSAILFIVLLFKDWGLESGTLLVILSIFTITIKYTFDSFWNEYIQPFLVDHINKLETELGKVRDFTQEALNSNQISAAISNATPEIAATSLPKIYEKAFGLHCASGNGLFAAMNKDIHPFLDPNKPHRSNHNTVVHITDHERGCVWNETSTYRMHTIAFDEDIAKEDVRKEPINHIVKYGTGLQVKKDGLLDHSLKVYIDNKLEYNSDADIILDSTGTVISKNPVAGISYDGTWLDVALSIPTEINKPWIDIRIEEKSVLEDDMLVGMRQEPTCGASLHINLPENWKFTEVHMSNSNDWTVTHPGGKNVLSANNQSWIMPGILYVCRWKRSDN